MTRFPAIRAVAPALAALGILAATVPASAPASARANFDGKWSVLIVTHKGTCDRAYRYPVKIENGSVGYAGDASFTVSGKVGDNGAVTVRVARGSQSANGQEIQIAAAVVQRKIIMLQVGHITSVTNPIPTATDSKTATPAT